jgi:hypothetical protein
MSVDPDGGRTDDGEMALAFALDAARRFADPATVFAEARDWSRSVGVVANDAAAVDAFVAEHDLTQDYSLDSDVWLTMQGIRESSDAPRHVFVGTTPEHRRVADATGWEFRDPEDVAAAAGWSLAGATDASGGVIARIRSWLDGSDAPDR